MSGSTKTLVSTEWDIFSFAKVGLENTHLLGGPSLPLCAV